MVTLVDTALQSPKGTGVVWRKTLESPGPKSRATYVALMSIISQ